MAEEWSVENVVKMQLFRWKSDGYFEQLPKEIGTLLDSAVTEFRLIATKEKLGNVCEQNDINIKKFKFFGLFKDHYCKLTGMPYTSEFTTIEMKKVINTIQTLEEHGANYVDYLTWFFEDFYDEIKENHPIPPFGYVYCSSICHKYLYTMKDQLKMKKKDVESMATRNLLLQIAIPFLERCKNKDLSAKMVEFSESKISATKFFELLKAFANKMGDQEAIEKCNEIESRKEQNNA